MRILPTLLLSACLASPFALLTASNAGASGFQGPAAAQNGGFQGPSSSNGASTAAEALKSPDDTYCSLTGNIISRTGHEKYLFKDQTGTITVEIDDKKFYGRTVTPETVVRIVGEVDWHVGNNEIEVDYLEIISK